MANKKAQIARALELRNELYDIANSLAGDETGSSAVLLHEACNCISQASKKFETGDQTIPIRLIQRSMFPAFAEEPSASIKHFIESI